ncbi:MAG: cytochrome c oxidase assembly protein [Chloroflexota bacterium]|nr:cytochrome c oxidase assembly protein [Chloroflexota bacterium]
MNPLASALLQSWEWRIDVILVLMIAGALYTRGWRRLHAIVCQHPETPRTNPRSPLVTGWKLASYWSGLAVLAVALMSPIDVLSSQLFSMHMIQHLLLVMIAPPLLLIANPFPIIMWSLPVKARRQASQLLNQETRFRQVLTRITAPGIVWFLYVAVYIGWHDPDMYNLALQSNFFHDLEHITFFVTAMLFWWHVTGVAPRFHKTFTGSKRLLYVISVIPVNMFAGVAIAFANQPIYDYYTTVPRFYGLSVMEDQMLAGTIMWIPGSMMFLLAALILLARIVQTEADKSIDANPAWLVDENSSGHH